MAEENQHEDRDDLVDDDQVENQEPEQDDEPESDPKLEAEARKYGWRPKEEFDRDPAGWVDAKRYLELPTTEVKQLRDELRTLKSRDSSFEDRLKRLDEANKAAMRRALENQKAEYERTMSDITERQRQAVETADVDEWQRLEKRRSEIAPPTEEPVDDAPTTPPEVEEYARTDAGKWVNDPMLRAWGAQAINMGGKANAPVAEQLEYAEQQVRQYFPHMFQQAEPPKHRSKVDGGGLGGAQRGKGFNSLPAEGKAAAKEFVEAGIYKSVEDYAKDYWAQEAAE